MISSYWNKGFSLQKSTRYFTIFSAKYSSGTKLFFENIHRGLIRVSGDEVHEFLQGLITNDISHINNTSNRDNAMFTMFLNKQGRVLYDTIIYRQRNEKTSCIIECDRTIEEQLKQHLLHFRFRKNINIDIITQEMNIWACFQDFHDLHRNTKNNFQVTHQHEYWKLGAIICSDPRLQLGLRIITPKYLQIPDFQHINDDRKCVLPNTSYNYKKLRYIHGISEGIVAYLDNLTSQMLDCSNYDEPILNEKDQIIGKLKGIQDEFGIGLLKIDLALSSKHLKIGSLNASTYRPTWWPQKKKLKYVLLL
ncbi:LOW QUALITY PROTEIN: putative transferase CAF17 homolog, mitochondrial [Sitodiplosis mosellana]|uniref:LOW QUALITY PROTEIN: putative transferase CAF17 homolog, mitochondrial n=1 Tax=Sitodiplosis mosellana TaxID=263140 RepID=UPI002444E192|nr:LOW QUALITY PROTEIN: putative transferase CAF17 homolog, mitochondrial [Sitodiplosis mosellana]